jgi:hypothetical protein
VLNIFIRLQDWRLSMKKKWVFLSFSLLFLTFFLLGESCRQKTTQSSEQVKIDSRSYNLGVIAAFAEIVSMDVKKLALSAPLTPQEMDGLITGAEIIANENGVSIYIEKNFLVTDLFPETLTKGKYVLMIYKPPIKMEYLKLKEEKNRLVDSGRYEDQARKLVARKMGRLLSYPESKIDNLLNEE